MNLKRKFLTAMLFASLAFPLAPALADDDHPNIFVKMCDLSPDKKVTKAQVMDEVSKMFDKADTRKEGKLDKKQAENFHRMFTAPTGG